MLPLIEERRLELEASPASLLKLLRVKMLLRDINNNRRRVQELFQRIDDAEDNEEDIWKLLACQGLKGVKIGQGIPFLPTSLKGLRTVFGALWAEFTKNGSAMVKNKLLPVLKELLHRGGITDEQFFDPRYVINLC